MGTLLGIAGVLRMRVACYYRDDYILERDGYSGGVFGVRVRFFFVVIEKGVC